MKTLRKFMLVIATFVLIVLVGCIANQIYYKDNIVEITQTGFIIFIDLVALIALYLRKDLLI